MTHADYSSKTQDGTGWTQGGDIIGATDPSVSAGKMAPWSRWRSHKLKQGCTSTFAELEAGTLACLPREFFFLTRCHHASRRARFLSRDGRPEWRTQYRNLATACIRFSESQEADDLANVGAEGIWKGFTSKAPAWKGDTRYWDGSNKLCESRGVGLVLKPNDREIASHSA